MPNFKIKLERKGGNIDHFNAWVAGKKVIGSNQGEAPSWEGNVEEKSDGTIKLTVRAVGNDGAKYKLSFTRESSIDNQSIEVKLSGGISNVIIIS